MAAVELFTCNVGRAREVTENGIRYFVAPISLIVPGVLPGSQGPLLYPPSECQRNVAAWDGTPIVVYHPQVGGQWVSATHPEVGAIGELRNTVFDSKLRTFGWFRQDDTRRADRRVYDALRNGRPMEVSTGLFTRNEPGGGTHNGKWYHATARDYRPDHLAVLPDQVGACSVGDGCGLNVNTIIVNPAVSEAQRRYLNATFGHDWVKEHGFDNKGKLPERKEEEVEDVKNAWSDAAREASIAARQASNEARRASSKTSREGEQKSQRPQRLARAADQASAKSGGPDPAIGKTHAQASKAHQRMEDFHRGKTEEHTISAEHASSPEEKAHYEGRAAANRTAAEAHKMAAALHNDASLEHGHEPKPPKKGTQNMKRCTSCGEKPCSCTRNMKYCPRCGAEMDDGEDECEECGYVENSNPEGINQYTNGGTGTKFTRSDSSAASVHATTVSKQAKPSDYESHEKAYAAHNDAAFAHSRDMGAAKKSGDTEKAAFHEKQEQKHLRMMQSHQGAMDKLTDNTKVSACPECGRQMVDGQCECGYSEKPPTANMIAQFWRWLTGNSNPEGYNQYKHAGEGASKSAALKTQEANTSSYGANKGKLSELHKSVQRSAQLAVEAAAKGDTATAKEHHEYAADGHKLLATLHEGKARMEKGSARKAMQTEAAQKHRDASAEHGVAKGTHHDIGLDTGQIPYESTHNSSNGLQKLIKNARKCPKCDDDMDGDECESCGYVENTDRSKHTGQFIGKGDGDSKPGPVHDASKQGFDDPNAPEGPVDPVTGDPLYKGKNNAKKCPECGSDMDGDECEDCGYTNNRGDDMPRTRNNTPEMDTFFGAIKDKGEYKPELAGDSETSKAAAGASSKAAKENTEKSHTAAAAAHGKAAKAAEKEGNDKMQEHHEQMKEHHESRARISKMVGNGATPHEVLNALSVKELNMLFARNDGGPAAADAPGKKGAIDSGGYSTDDDDFEWETPKKGLTDNEWLEQAPASVREDVLFARNMKEQEKRRLVTVLNASGDEQLGKYLMAKPLPELRMLAKNFGKQDRSPEALYIGGAPVDNYNQAVSEELLLPPTMNWSE